MGRVASSRTQMPRGPCELPCAHVLGPIESRLAAQNIQSDSQERGLFAKVPQVSPLEFITLSFSETQK
jgi:hypothetical protein